MNYKRFITAFVVVFILLEVLNYLVHGVILGPVYQSEEVSSVFRSQQVMESNMWIMYIMDLIWAFFFTFIFVKGYENKGIFEGFKYGLYIGLFYNLVGAYSQYAVYPLPYALTFQWFVYGLVISIVLGITASIIYKPAAPGVPEEN